MALPRLTKKRGDTLEVVFWRRVDKSGECWTWTGMRKETGYGRLNVGGRYKAAHRVSWELANGPIPTGSHVCHHCDNPPCVNPAHLFLGNQQINVADMVAKGRNQKGDRSGSRLHPESRPRGEDSGMAKLTNALVIEARERAARGEKIAHIAASMNLTWATVGNAVRRISWRHVP